MSAICSSDRRRREPGAEQLVPVVDPEIQRHQPDPDQAVRRPPRLRIGVAEDQELRRQRPGAALEEGIDAVGIGLEPGDRRRLEVSEARFGQAIQAERAHEPVARQRRRAKDLREPPRAQPPAELHLEEPVLGMGEAEAEGRIQETRRPRCAGSRSGRARWSPALRAPRPRSRRRPAATTAAATSTRRPAPPRPARRGRQASSRASGGAGAPQRFSNRPASRSRRVSSARS